MSQNDLIALESNFQNWVKERAQGLKSIDPFLYYCVEHFLKSFDLSDEEIIYGIVDAPNDGGVDAIYFLVNQGELVRGESQFEPKGVSRVRLIIIQVKTSGGFSMNEIEKLTVFTDHLLNLSLPTSNLTTRYHSHLIEIMQTFKDKYGFISGGFPRVAIDFYYITKADEAQADAKAQESADRVKQKVKAHLDKAECEYHFINAQGLLDQVQRRPTRERTLKWAENPMQTDEGFVGLVNLRDYYSFIVDENGRLADRIFESNVRGFQQDTTVNTQIRETLRSTTEPNFWHLNNGITIIATKTQSAGVRLLTVEDPQIVNGLQTSTEIFKYFNDTKPTTEPRAILVKVIQTNDDEVRDAIIKATNLQNKMLPASLRATDPIHRQIEDLFKQRGLFYDRRKGYYRDKGKPIRQIVSVSELVQAVLSIVLQRPNDARARPGDYIKDEDSYKVVFGGDFPLVLYPTCAQIMRRVEEFLDSQKLDRGEQRNLQFYVATYLTSMLLKELDPTPDRILTIKTTAIDEPALKGAYERVRAMYQLLDGDDTVARGPELLKRLRSQIRRRLAGKRKAVK